MLHEYYEVTIRGIVHVVEATGAAIMVFGGLYSLIIFAISVMKKSNENNYEVLRQHLGESILLGLEVLIIGDIVRTIVVDTTVNSVAVLGVIVIIRIILSFSLELEMYGTWPWDRWKCKQESNVKLNDPSHHPGNGYSNEEHIPLLQKNQF